MINILAISMAGEVIMFFVILIFIVSFLYITLMMQREKYIRDKRRENEIMIENTEAVEKYLLTTPQTQERGKILVDIHNLKWYLKELHSEKF